jgi:hypothetical protein
MVRLCGKRVSAPLKLKNSQQNYGHRDLRLKTDFLKALNSIFVCRASLFIGYLGYFGWVVRWHSPKPVDTFHSAV